MYGYTSEEITVQHQNNKSKQKLEGKKIKSYLYTTWHRPTLALLVTFM